TYTDAAGTYSFGSIAYGSYIIYPETYKYYTTPSAVITLSASSATASAINFKKHTSYGTVTPVTITAIKPEQFNEGINVYPNPTSGIIGVQWQNQATGIADVIVTDMTGREVYKSSINMGTKSGNAEIGLSELRDGIY